MVGIVILNYNNSAQTLACVDSLRRCCPSEVYKLCVVDNCSRDEEFLKLSALGDAVKIIRSEVNGGYARGNDIGCGWFDGDASIDRILILNDDTRFTMDILTPMSVYLDSHPECGVVFPMVYAPDGTIDPACMRVQKSARDLIMQASSLPRRLGLRRREFLSQETLSLCVSVDGNGMKRICRSECGGMLVPPGSCMMLRKTDFRKIGWLDPHTFLYFEEHILTAKLQREGLGSALLPELSIIHLGAQTTTRQSSKAIYRHWRDSYLYFLDNFSVLRETVFTPVRLYLRLRTYLSSL